MIVPFPAGNTNCVVLGLLNNMVTSPCVGHVCVASGERWPLLIDPQLQGIKWIKSRCGSSLKVVNLGQRG